MRAIEYLNKYMHSQNMVYTHHNGKDQSWGKAQKGRDVQVKPTQDGKHKGEDENSRLGFQLGLHNSHLREHPWLLSNHLHCGLHQRKRQIDSQLILNPSDSSALSYCVALLLWVGHKDIAWRQGLGCGWGTIGWQAGYCFPFIIFLQNLVRYNKIRNDRLPYLRQALTYTL